MFQDYLFFGVDVKVYYCYRMLHLSKLVEEVKKIHHLNTNRALLLSDALLGSVLLSSILGYEEKINLRIQCHRDFTIGTETSSQAETRGYIECNEDSNVIKQLDLGNNVIPQLQIRIMKSQRKVGHLSESNHLSNSNSIGVALNEYLALSYKMNTYLSISSWVNEDDGKINAFGVIFQELPDIPESVSKKLQNHVLNLVSMKELFLENSDADILSKKLIPDEIKGVKSINPKFICGCSQEKVENVLVSLPLEELTDILNKAEDVEINCHYCNTNYIIPTIKVAQLYSSRSSTSLKSSEIN